MESPGLEPRPLPRSRLDSWKEIAAYLRRDVRTLQRWEKEEGLPVHRLVHGKQGTVYAIPSELDIWWESRRRTLEHIGQSEREKLSRGFTAAMAAAAVLVTIATWQVGRKAWQPSPGPPARAVDVLRLSAALPKGVVLAANDTPAMSPDGRLLAFAATLNQGPRQLWIRALDANEPQLMPGTEGAAEPFFSPDSRSIAFFAQNTLKRIDVAGGAVHGICDLPHRRGPAFGGGGAWNADGTIIFAPSTFGDGLYRASATGSIATPLTTLDDSRKEETHTSPYFFPDGRHFAYTIDSAVSEHRGVYVGSLDSTGRTLLIPTLTNVYVAAGRLVFARGQTLVAQPFDLERFKAHGELEVLAEDLVRDANGPTAEFAASLGGRVAYVTDASANRRQFTWVDRAGTPIGTVGEPGPWTAPALAPDGRRFLATFVDPVAGADLWLFDTPRTVSTRFTADSEWNSFGIWSPDGANIVFSSDRSGVMNLYEKPADGSRRERQLFANSRATFATGWSNDGRYLLFQQHDRATDRVSAWIWPVDSSQAPSLLVDSKFNVSSPTLSPGMRWLAYTSDESGRDEVYVQRFPDAGIRGLPLNGSHTRVSTAGGRQPHWRRDERELLFADATGNVVAADVRDDGQLRIGRPIVLFKSGVAEEFTPHRYDVVADGQRFLIVRSADSQGAATLTILSDWAR